MTDTLTVLGVVDDSGPEQGLITSQQMTDDITPAVRVSLTTGSGAAIQAGDTVRVDEAGSAVGQATVTADDVSRGYVDVAAHYVMPTTQSLSAGAYDAGGALLAGGGLTVLLAPSGAGVVHTGLTDGGYTLSFTNAASAPFYTAFIQRYDHGGQAIGQAFQGQYESGSPDDYSVTPLANGNYVALFLDGDHFTNRKGPVVDAHGAVLNTVTTGFNGVATAGALGGFLTKWVDVGSTGETILHTYDNAGVSMSNDLHMLGPVTSVVAEAGGKIDVNWDDFGATRTLALDPSQANTLTGPAPVSLTAWDDYGSQTGQIPAGGVTDDATPTLRVAVRQTGEVVVSLSHDNGFTRSEAQVTDADVARGYVDVRVNASRGDGSYSASARFLDANGLTTPRVTTSFTLQTSPPPPPPSGGQVLQGQPGGSNLAGGAGDDTLIGGSGPDVMTGAGGADHFAFQALPWSAADITDFTDGTDKLDLSGLLSSVGYAGSDPIGDGYVKLIDDGSGGTWLYFDTDGHGSGDAWGTFVATLEHVAPASITDADLVGGTSTSPPPPPPPPPPPGGQTLQGQPGGSNLTGGSGDDTLIGGSGPDTMTGAGGADHFTWTTLPWQGGEVTDFTQGVDKIDVSQLLASVGYSGSDPIADNYIRLAHDGGGDTWLYFDRDGNGSADPWGTFIARIDHIYPSQLTASDFIFH